MPQPFYDRLQQYYEQVDRVLRGQASVASIFPNPSDVGLTREHVYVRFLREHLPTSCNVTLGGFLFALDGSESRQIDVIVTASVAPQFAFPQASKSFACVDGTLAVASVKSNLTSGELEAALKNIASIPPSEPLGNKVMPLLSITDYDDWPFKVVFAPRGITLKNAMNTLNAFYTRNTTVPYGRRPNIIHVAGKYAVIRTGAGGAITRGGVRIPPGVFYPQPDETGAYALAYVVARIQRAAVVARNILFNYDAILGCLPLATKPAKSVARRRSVRRGAR